uniref:6-phosphofructo-2-kinase/fructose-2, 6-bisphosphatase 4-like isoform X2 n=1 Tax=Myxine glutinosa TaxID=7769 RepID=UPI00358DED75
MPIDSALGALAFPVKLSSGTSDHSVLSPTLVVMVGLPARGKTSMAIKLARYLNWLGFPTRIFNAGQYRRESVKSYKSHELFAPTNEEGVNIRRHCARAALHDARWYLSEAGGKVAIFDATNTTRERRAMILELNQDWGCKVLFVESLCDDADVISANIKQVKLNNRDYSTFSRDAAMTDFRKRIECYEAAHEPLDENFDRKLSYIKVVDGGCHLIVNKLASHMQSKIAICLMSLRLCSRSVYLWQLEGDSGRPGSDSTRNWQFVEALAQYIHKEDAVKIGLPVWSGHHVSSSHVAQSLGLPVQHWCELDGVDMNDCILSSNEASQHFRDGFARREGPIHQTSKQENYGDVVRRLEPLVLELERQCGALVLCSEMELRILLAYFLDVGRDDVMHLKCTKHTVFKLTPTPYGCKMETVHLSLEPTNGHRTESMDIVWTAAGSPSARVSHFEDRQMSGTLCAEISSPLLAQRVVKIC